VRLGQPQGAMAAALSELVLGCSEATSVNGYRGEYSAHGFAGRTDGREQVASREFNEEIEELSHGDPPSKRLDIVCECALGTCDRAINITIAEYRLVRNDPLQFVIEPEHLIGDIERIVYENDRFVVVAKREGVPADVARDENPRG
jgi:hypothetical protein